MSKTFYGTVEVRIVGISLRLCVTVVVGRDEADGCVVLARLTGVVVSLDRLLLALRHTSPLTWSPPKSASIQAGETPRKYGQATLDGRRLQVFDIFWHGGAMDNNFDNIRAFEEHQGVEIPDWWERGLTLVSLVLDAHETSTDVIRTASEETLITEPTIGFINHLLDRAYDHVSASIVCFATPNAATAEVAARVGMETSANIRYMLAGERNARFLMWLQAYIEQDRKQIKNWEVAISKRPEPEAVSHREGIERRRKRLANYEQFVEQMRHDFSSAGFETEGKKWPNIADRFEAIGESVSYRTAYARMSSQTHADAEDRISYIWARVIEDEQLIEQMSSDSG